MDVYEKCPELQNDHFRLRLVEEKDCEGLLKVYSDPEAVPLFNSDNCHGDNFFYQTPERMAQAIHFWLFSYNNRYFVRWSIIDRQSEEPVGTIELFQRESTDGLSSTALLRLDLRSDYERADVIESILRLIMVPACEWFDCASVTTKAPLQAAARRAALKRMGFIESRYALQGDDGTLYGDYFVCCKSE